MSDFPTKSYFKTLVLKKKASLDLEAPISSCVTKTSDEAWDLRAYRDVVFSSDLDFGLNHFSPPQTYLATAPLLRNATIGFSCSSAV